MGKIGEKLLIETVLVATFILKLLISSGFEKTRIKEDKHKSSSGTRGKQVRLELSLHSYYSTFLLVMHTIHTRVVHIRNVCRMRRVNFGERKDEKGTCATHLNSAHFCFCVDLFLGIIPSLTIVLQFLEESVFHPQRRKKVLLSHNIVLFAKVRIVKCVYNENTIQRFRRAERRQKG